MSLRYLLDTNICIYIAKQKPLTLLERFNKMSIGEAAMSIITYGELLYGAEKSHHPKKAKEVIHELSTLIPALPLTIQVSEHYGHIRSLLEKKGKPIGNNDLWIAAHTLALNITLVSNNLREFNRIPHLKYENWAE